MATSPPPTHLRRRASAAALLALVLALVMAWPARADTDPGTDLLGWIGQERSAAGLPGLQVAGDLVEVATRHAQRMAAEERLHHNASLHDEVDGWDRLTENVGVGPTARQVHDGFMDSSSHRNAIVDGQVTEVGVGVARTDGQVWIAQVFRRPSVVAGGGDVPPRPPPAPPVPPTATATDRAVPGPSADVAAGPAAGLVVGPALDGVITAAPSPATVRLLTALRWMVVLAGLQDD